MAKKPEIPKRRNFPVRPLEEALEVPRKIVDEMGGKPFRRLLLADALGIKPSSTNFRDILSASYKYGLSDGTEKATDISVTPRGIKAVGTGADAQKARVEALLEPPLFKSFFTDFAEKKLPSAEMLPKILVSQYEVPAQYAAECAELIQVNGRFVGAIRTIGGSPHVLLDSPAEAVKLNDAGKDSGDVSDLPGAEKQEDGAEQESVEPDENTKPPLPTTPTKESSPRPIFLGHGKNKTPLKALEEILRQLGVAHRTAIKEANLGRPIPQKVKETMLECGSAILIFTKDEKFVDTNGVEIWRASENVVHELGAASFAYEDRVVILKERGINFPTNFESVGYIEFDADSLEAQTMNILKELIGFGLVKVTPA